jgi:uncharacterized membrane protein (DUF2068 family)
LETNRPLGVTIIAILRIIGGIILLLGGIGLVTIAPFVGQLNVNTTSSTTDNGTGINLSNNNTSFLFFAAFIGVIGSILIVLGIASFVVAWGLLKGKGWAWTVTIVITIISLVFNALSILSGNIGAIVGIIIDGVIIYYLYRPNVKSYFGRVRGPTI